MKYKLRGRRLVLFVAILIFLTSCGGGVPAASWFGVSASDDTVYFAANEQVFALNLDSGTESWSFPSEPDKDAGPFYATPLLTNDTVVVGGFGDGKLYAISQSSGAQEWAEETEAMIVAGAVSTNGGIVVGNNEGEVFFVEAESREARILLKAKEAIWAAPLVDEDNGRLYVASMDHHVYAVDLDSGRQLWSFKAGGALVGTPAVSDRVLYFGALDSTFYAVDTETAAELWRFEADGWIWGGPVVHEGTVYFGDMAGNVYALSAKDGSQQWAFEVEGGVRVAPVVVSASDEQDASDLLYFGSREGKVFALNAEDGTQQWALSLNGAIYSQPIVHGGYLLVSPHNAKVRLVALDPESGAERWTYPPREE